MPSLARRLRTLCILGLLAAPAHAADDWMAVSFISETVGNHSNRLCMGVPDHMRGSDIGCPTYAPSLTTGGHVSITGNVSANRFIGDGSGLTNLNVQGDRIVSGTHGAIINEGTGTISLTTGGVPWGYFSAGWSRLANLFADTVSSTVVSATNVSATYVDAARGGTVSGTYGYFRHISSTYLSGDGSGLYNVPASAVSGLNLDRITSGSHAVIANQGTGYVSLTTGGTTWGYLSAGWSRLANLFADTVSSTLVSATNVSATYVDATRGGTVSGTYGYFHHISGTYVSGDGSGLYNVPASAVSGLNLDRITSGSHAVIANQNTGYVSLTTGGSTWGYLSAGWSRLANLFADTVSSTLVSATNVSATSVDTTRGGTVSGTYGYFRFISGTDIHGRFSGDGSGLTGVTAAASDRIVSGSTGGTRMVAISNTGYISITQAGANSGWFDPTRGLVTLGVSATGAISATRGYFSGNVGIGAFPNNNALYISGNVARIAADDYAQWSASSNGVNVFYGANGNTGRAYLGTTSNHGLRIYANNQTRMSIAANGNVGISTTDPLAKLDVVGTISASDAIQVGNSGLACSPGIAGALRYSGSKIEFCNGVAWGALVGAADAMGDRIVSGSTNIIAHQDRSLTFTTAGTQRMVIGENGYSLIGTGVPESALDVSISAPNDLVRIRIRNSGAGPDSASMLGMNVDNGAAAGFMSRSGSYVGVGATGRASGTVIYTSTATDGGLTLGARSPRGALYFYTGATLKMIVDPLGNVGIGSETPLAKLDVVGTISASNAIQVGTSALTCGAGIPGAIRYQGTTLQYCNGTVWTTLSAAGGGLEDRIVSGSTNIIANLNQSLTFSTAGAQRMIVGANGLVGIGTSNPINALHVDIQSLGDRRHIFLTNSDMPYSRVSMGDGTSTPGQFSPTFQGYSVNALRGTGFYANIDSSDDSGTAPAMFFVSRITSPSVAVVATRPLFDWRNNTTSHMVMDASGRLGIGTNLPRARLDVAGTISASDAIQVGTSALTCGAGIPGAIRYQGTTLQYCNGTVWATLSAAGGGLEDRIVSGSTNVIAHQDGSVTFSTDGAQRMVIGQTGNVGIGTSNASHPLHVLHTMPNNGNAAGMVLEKRHTSTPAPGANSTFGLRYDVENSAGVSVPAAGVYGGNEDSTAGSERGVLRLYVGSAGSLNVRTTVTNRGVEVIGTVSATDAVQVGESMLTCSAGIVGAMRYTSGTMQVCNGTEWGNIGLGVPTGTIAAFATANCPSGWNEYTPARGRFLRGVDPTGTNDSVRAAGNVQADALQNITGTLRFASSRSPMASTPGQGAFVATGEETNLTSGDGGGTMRSSRMDFDASQVARTANETRPKNVAVRFCMYAGFESAVATGITTLGGLSDVAVGGATPGQVLAFDGASWVASDTTGGSTALGDRITSGTHVSVVNENTGYVSLTTGGSTWGYLGSGNSYLPTLVATKVSATNISATYVQLSSATTPLACDAGIPGAIRYQGTSLQFCNGTSWTTLGSAGAATAASSTGAVQFNAGGSLGGDTTNFFWDNAAKRLAIGGGLPPSGTLHLQGQANTHALYVKSGSGSYLSAPMFAIDSASVTDTAAAWGLSMVNTNTTNNNRLRLGFYTHDLGGNIGIGSEIQTVFRNRTANGFEADMVFITKSTDSVNTERLRLTSAGHVGVGTPSPTATLQVSGSFIVSTSTQLTTPSLYVGADGRVGIGGMPNAARMATFGDFLNGDMTLLADLRPSFRADATGTYHYIGSAIQPNIDFADGTTNSGYVQAQTITTFRRNIGGDAGTLASLIGQRMVYGHYQANASTRHTNAVTGIELGGYAQNGTIGSMHALYIRPLAGTNVEKSWGIYQQGGSEQNYFAGRIGVGSGRSEPSATLDVAGTISASGAIQVGTSSLTCGAGIPGAIRYNAPNLQFCNGTSWTNIGGSGGGGQEDRIVSGTHAVTVNEDFGLVSLSTGETTWGYLNSTRSYLPALSSVQVSSTNVSATLLQVGTGNGAACDVSRRGAMRYSTVSSTVEYCQGSAWVSMGPSATTVPSFRAFLSAAQSIPQNTDTRVDLDTIDFDTYNNFDTGNGSFTPTVPGTYVLTANAAYSSLSANQYAYLFIRKNGSVVSQIHFRAGSSNDHAGRAITAIVQANGTTDSFDIAVRHSASSAASLYSNHHFTSFSGALISMAGGGGAGGGGPTALGDLTNVNTAGATPGSIIRYDGSNWVVSDTSSALGDSITSGTHAVAVNETSGYVSLSTGGSTWGYLGSGNSYLPTLVAGRVSSTNISATLAAFNGTNITNVMGAGGNALVSGTTSVTAYSSGSIILGTPQSSLAMNGTILDFTNSLPVIRLIDSNSVGDSASAYMSFHDSTGARTGFVGDGSVANSNIYVYSDSGSVIARTSGNNTCTYSSGASWSCSSDARMKDRIVGLEDSLEKIVKLRGVTYHWRDAGKSKEAHLGFIAQEVQKVFPEVVSKNDDDGMLQLDYAALVSPIVEAIKELTLKLDAVKLSSEKNDQVLRAEIDALRKELQELKSKNK